MGWQGVLKGVELGLSITETLLIAIIFITLVAILQSRDIISKEGWGGRFLLVAAVFMALSVGFRVLADVASLYGSESVARQIKWAGIYIGYTVAGIATILGSILIALQSLIKGFSTKPAANSEVNRGKTGGNQVDKKKLAELVRKFAKSGKNSAKVRSSRPILEVYDSLSKIVEKMEENTVEVEIGKENVYLKKKR